MYVSVDMYVYVYVCFYMCIMYVYGLNIVISSHCDSIYVKLQKT